MRYSSELLYHWVITYYTILPETTFQGEKVYMRSIQPENPDWYLLYDFGLKVGDEVVVYDFQTKINNDGERVDMAIPARLKCLERDFYLNDEENSAPLMRLQCLEQDGHDYSQLTDSQGDWIIGMGYLGSGNLLAPWCRGWDGAGSRTICVESPDGNVVFGKPVAGMKSVSETSSSNVDGVYNLQGVRVSDSSANLPRGLYVSNGKKICVTK